MNMRQSAALAFWKPRLPLAIFSLDLLLMLAFFFRQGQEETKREDGPPTIQVNGAIYTMSGEFTNFEACPDGFSYAGDLEAEGQGIRPDYTSPESAEWIYVYQWCRAQYSDDVFQGYVRYDTQS